MVTLPVEGDTSPFMIMGLCVEQCEVTCATVLEDVECGVNGRTYLNSCYRTCNNVQVNQ